MARRMAWALFFLGVAHLVFGVLQFRDPLIEALTAGVVDQFRQTESRRAAFWFLMCGPLLMLAGHLGLRAVRQGDHAALKVIGRYGLVCAGVGVIAFPASPLWVLLGLSGLLLGLRSAEAGRTTH